MIIKETDVITSESVYKVKIFFDDISIIDLFLDANLEAISEVKYIDYKSIYYIFINYSSNKQAKMIDDSYFKNESNQCLCDNFIYYLIDINQAKEFYQNRNFQNYLHHEIKMLEFIYYFLLEQNNQLINYIRKNKCFNFFQREKLISDILKLRD